MPLIASGAFWDLKANMQQRPCKSKIDDNLKSMSTSLTLIFQIIPIIILVAFILQQSHLLISLLTLEGLALSLVLNIPVGLTIAKMSLSVLSIIMLSFSACEARLGLALLVLIARTHGTDIVNNLITNKC